ncbi:MAG: FtsW/RodA/SpoVE family cell cycle protein [Eubacteriales bacterium]
MDNNRNNGRTTHAHRTPESVSSQRNASQRQSSAPNTARNTLRVGNPGSSRSDKNYTFRAGEAKKVQNMTAQRRITSLTPAEQKKLQRREKRERNELEKERKWQEEVVRIRGGIDVFMLVIILILLALGTITVFSASYPLAISEDENSNFYILKQIKFLLIGGAAMAIEILIIPVKFYKSKFVVFTAYFVSMALLIYTFFKGNAEGEAVRWITIPGLFNLQPSELMKISLVLMLAWYADRYEKQMKELKLGFTSYKYNIIYPCLILGGACIFVLIGKHLSGTIIIGVIGFFMMIVAGCRILWLLETVIPIGGAVIGLFLAMNPYALKRITTFTDENADILSDFYQTTQSLYAIGSGGLFGVGLGQSRQKYSYLTQAHTDFIFSIWCEEWGFVGAVLLIVLFILFVWRGYVIALRAPDKFTMLTAFGITTHVGLQAFLNMCVASDLIMNTGITLPFFSYGGSSLVVLMMEMGILLSISRQYYRKKSDIEREEMMRQLGMD